jgi:hypothetical protein
MYEGQAKHKSRFQVFPITQKKEIVEIKGEEQNFNHRSTSVTTTISDILRIAQCSDQSIG